jgi:two-component system, chemotaxis family, chemotaxis protein CheY
MPKVLIADDSELMRKIVSSLLSKTEGWAVCGEADNGQQAVMLAQELKPDLIVLDLAMPLLDGLHACAEILKFMPLVPIVLYTMHKAPEIELEAKKAGAKAVVSKSDDPNVLLETLKELVAESVAASPVEALSETLFNTIPTIPAQAPIIVPDTLASAGELARTTELSSAVAASASANGAGPSATRQESPASDANPPTAKES